MQCERARASTQLWTAPWRGKRTPVTERRRWAPGAAERDEHARVERLDVLMHTGARSRARRDAPRDGRHLDRSKGAAGARAQGRGASDGGVRGDCKCHGGASRAVFLRPPLDTSLGPAEKCR